MKILAVDDERRALDTLVKLLWEVQPDAELTSFTESEDAFTYLAENKVDIAFLDIKMGGLSGLALAEKCKTLCPQVNIIFVTGYSRYALDALNLHVSGYLMKPVRAEDLRAEIENLRYPVSKTPEHRVRIQTFGNFEVFVDNKPLALTSTKARECLAYLVDRRGARVSYPELSSILWEDRPYDQSVQNNAHQTVFTLMSALKEVGVQDILIKTHKEIALDTSRVDCDYYAAIGDDPAQMNAFAGEYMRQYSWAELTLAALCRMVDK